jgi:hypothetical protein
MENDANDKVYTKMHFVPRPVIKVSASGTGWSEIYLKHQIKTPIQWKNDFFFFIQFLYILLLLLVAEVLF